MTDTPGRISWRTSDSWDWIDGIVRSRSRIRAQMNCFVMEQMGNWVWGVSGIRWDRSAKPQTRWARSCPSFRTAIAPPGLLHRRVIESRIDWVCSFVSGMVAGGVVR